MFAFFRAIVGIAVLVFVIATMLNVGLTQAPAEILRYLRNWRFVLRMLIANFVLVPLTMILILRVTSFEPAMRAGLLVFSLGAGAPFLIKLTQVAEHHLALGAAVMMLLMVATIIYVPLVLPHVVSGSTMSAATLTRTLLRQMLAPTAAGMITAQLLPTLARIVQPWVARLANLALYVVLAATFIGYYPNLADVVRSGALLAAVVFVLIAFGLGYLAGGGADHLEDVGALGTAQRNTAAGLIVATQTFSDPNVLVLLSLANTVGLVLLIALARFVRRDNPVHAAA
ncbi:MAG TPA: bile acid:sodium symporter [Gemmatimonadaceae bacterium]